MLKDGKRYKSPGDFDAEYGVVENTYETQDAEYNSNRRTSKRRTKSKQLPGVSPLVFSRFLLEYTAFLSLSDMGKNLPDYEEIPVPLEMPEDVRTAYKEAEHELQKVLRTDRKAAQKILSTYLNLLTVYPDQPYDQPEVVHPLNGMPIVTPKNCGDFSRLLPKEERVLELVRQKAANGERVLIYTSWTRTDSQKKLQKLLCSEGYRTEILTPQIATDKREDWVNKRVKNGLQVLITNPRCVETGLDLNAFTTIIFYSMGYNLFTLRQASRRSWRINQTAPRVEVYMLYYRALSTTVGKLLFSSGKSVLSFEVPVMYGIEYEDDILLLLRMIKFLHMQSPDAAHIFCQSHPVVDMEELLMVIDEVMWDIFDDVNFFFDEEYEATVVQCSHPVIDRLYELGRASDPKHGSRQSVWSKKLHDITEYFVLGATNSVYKFSQHIAGDHVVLEFCLSPDYYEPLYFANSLVDLLRYCQCSVRRIEAKLAERETENIRKEAA